VLVLVLVVAMSGCVEENQEVMEVLTNNSEQQSTTLKNSRVIATRAYWFGLGFTVYSEEGKGFNAYSEEGKRLVALYIEYWNHSDGLELDDIEVIDYDTGINYGHSQEVILYSQDAIALYPEGIPIRNESEWPRPPEPLIVLLIYEFPENGSRIMLSYRGENILSNPVSIEKRPYICGTIAGLTCPDGYYCYINAPPNIMDASGVCKKCEENSSIYSCNNPSPTSSIATTTSIIDFDESYCEKDNDCGLPDVCSPYKCVNKAFIIAREPPFICPAECGPCCMSNCECKCINNTCTLQLTPES